LSLVGSASRNQRKTETGSEIIIRWCGCHMEQLDEEAEEPEEPLEPDGQSSNLSAPLLTAHD